MKLYQFPHSPYCIPIALILKNSGLQFDEVTVPSWDRQMVAQLTDGKYYEVPVIQNGDDIVYESTETSLDVARYVSGLVSTDLFPKAYEGVQEVLIAHIEGKMEGLGFKTVDPIYLDAFEKVAERTALVRHKERKFGRGCVERWREQYDELLNAFYAEVDKFQGSITEHGYLLRDQPVFADYALYGVVGNVHFFPQNVRWEGREWLRDWMTNLEVFKL